MALCFLCHSVGICRVFDLGYMSYGSRDRSGQVRVFYYVKRGDVIYLIHAFRKKTQQIPQKELDTVLKRIREINPASFIFEKNE